METIYATDMSNIFSKAIGKITGARQKEEKLEELKKICEEYNRNSRRLLENANTLFKKRKRYCEDTLKISKILKDIKNLPKWFYDNINDSKERMKDFELAVEYESDPVKFAEVTDKTGRTSAYVGAGTATGAAIAALGPTAAMSIATVLGTASTGTAISALSGVAATNAALAWLGGGTIAAGGAGMAGGSLVLGMFGPIGAAIAGVSAIGGLAVLRSKNRKLAEEVGKNIEIIYHDNKSLAMKIQQLVYLEKRSDYNANRLNDCLIWAEQVHPKDYELWSQVKKDKLEELANVVSHTVQLINERV